ncbi:MAG: PorP/SprF family type IX secretion system membrane protein [Chitinophagales bacterium]
MKRDVFYYGIALCVILFFSVNGYAQDPQFSQSYLSRIYLNPATTGSEQGTTVFLNYRNQWANIDNSFNTASFSLDAQSPRFSSGFGVHAMYDAAGAASLRTNMAGLTYAYILRINDNFNINFGLGASYVHKSIDRNSLIFSSDLDAIYGVTGNDVEGVVVNDKVNFVDIDAGVLFQFSFKIAKRYVHNSAGFAVHHLTTPIESFQAQESRVPRRYTFHYGAMIPVTENILKKRSVYYISPIVKYEIQNGVDIFTGGFFNTFKPLFVGVLYQDNGFTSVGGTRALIFTGGVSSSMGKHTNFTLGYSYDLNLSGVTNVSGGVHELAVKFNFENAELFSKTNKGNNPTKCYKFKGKGSIRLF